MLAFICFVWFFLQIAPWDSSPLNHQIGEYVFQPPKKKKHIWAEDLKIHSPGGYEYTKRSEKSSGQISSRPHTTDGTPQMVV